MGGSDGVCDAASDPADDADGGLAGDDAVGAVLLGSEIGRIGVVGEGCRGD